MTEEMYPYRERGAALRELRERHGLNQQELAEAIGLKSRYPIGDAEAGRESAHKTLQKAEDYMAGYDASVADEHESGTVEYRIAGNFGVSVILKGTGVDMADLEASALRIMRAAADLDQRND